MGVALDPHLLVKSGFHVPVGETAIRDPDTCLRHLLRSVFTLGFAALTSVCRADDGLARAQELFDQAAARRADGDYAESIRLLQRIVSDQPALGRARAELALTQYQALNFAAARSEAEKLLADPSLPPNVRNNLRSLLDRIDLESRTHTLQPFVSVGLGSDSNANVGPSADTVQVGGASLTLVPGSTRQRDTFTQVNAGVSHRYLSPRTLDLMGAGAAMIWQSSASYFTQNYRSLPRFDLDVASLATGPAVIVAGKARAGLSLQHDEIGLGHSRLAGYTGISPNLTLTFGGTEISADAQSQRRRFHDAANRGRDSQFVSAGLTLGRALAGGAASLQIGARWFNENASDQRFGNRGDEVFAGATWRAWQGGQVFGRSGLRRPSYKDVEPLFNQVRADHERRNSLGLSHSIQSGVGAGIIVTLSASFTRNRSTVPIYQYERDQISLSASKTF